MPKLINLYWIIPLSVLAGCMGCIALIIWLKKRHTRTRFQEVLGNYRGFTVSEDLPGEFQEQRRWQNQIVQEVEKLNKQVEALETLITGLDEKIKKILTISAVAASKDDQYQTAEHNIICKAFNSGQSVTEIARRFNKGKGEVELILNLKRNPN